MARVAFYFAITLFLAAFVIFAVALFEGLNGIATSIVGVIDGILGLILKIVYTHLFPPQKP